MLVHPPQPTTLSPPSPITLSPQPLLSPMPSAPPPASGLHYLRAGPGPYGIARVWKPAGVMSSVCWGLGPGSQICTLNTRVWVFAGFSMGFPNIYILNFLCFLEFFQRLLGPLAARYCTVTKNTYITSSHLLFP